MEQTELTGFIILGNILLLVFFTGIFLFILQYRKRKMQHEQEKKMLEEEHSLKLLHSQIATQHETMQFIGSEIHDSVSQKLTLASLYASRLEYANQYPQLTEQLQHVNRIIHDSLEELRNLSRNLTDTNLQHAGLAEILRMECAQVNETGICTATLETEGTLPGIPVTIKSILQRVAQEFIQNSLKHSGAANIFISLRAEGNQVQLDMKDDGKGFEPGAVPSQGIGLTNMRRRIENTGAMYNMESAPGSGTRLRIKLPGELFNDEKNA